MGTARALTTQGEPSAASNHLAKGLPWEPGGVTPHGAALTGHCLHSQEQGNRDLLSVRPAHFTGNGQLGGRGEQAAAILQQSLAQQHGGGSAAVSERAGRCTQPDKGRRERGAVVQGNVRALEMTAPFGPPSPEAAIRMAPHSAPQPLCSFPCLHCMWDGLLHGRGAPTPCHLPALPLLTPWLVGQQGQCGSVVEETSGWQH
ncbi:phosphatidylinositol 4,5-bisphosphate 3-kinase catalytic subunit beta isoform [Platysternon megacephalum]|uniref:Phosphatidylinositol 4,5-bisphosphate 3-kinase catalytic subunit beta isoform n=1 Tax=Platysternon megacephalum TaxID=55544 RepID=A0A4D9DVK9_9SAUR|nr:phosphatidylinositol 4,5-bisphosphate 3-kinase catalytic subunit beta isoform [Platysternon megacephalum]